MAPCRLRNPTGPLATIIQIFYYHAAAIHVIVATGKRRSRHPRNFARLISSCISDGSKRDYNNCTTDSNSRGLPASGGSSLAGLRSCPHTVQQPPCLPSVAAANCRSVCSAPRPQQLPGSPSDLPSASRGPSARVVSL